MHLNAAGVLAASPSADPITLLLVAAVVVLCAATVAMIVSGGSADRARRAEPAHHLGAMPVVPLITPASRRHPPVVEAHIVRSADGEAARQPPEPLDDRSGRAARVEEAHALVDRLAETDPQRLAEIIKQWLNPDDPSN